jgi:hypothetical protein
MIKAFLFLSIFTLSFWSEAQDLDPNILINGSQDYCQQSVLSYKTTSAGECPDVYAPLKQGEHRRMRQITGYIPELWVSRGQTTGDYLLRYLPDGRYQAVMSVNFKPTAGATPEDANNMLLKVRRCMQKISPHLLGADGKNLDVVILSSDEAERIPKSDRPNTKEILVRPKVYRGDSEDFGVNFDCKTIGHEILHHLSLVDEYLETETEKYSEWSCRPTTKKPSYMRELDEPFNSVIPRNIVCECDKTCQEIMSTKSFTKKIYFSKNITDLMSANLIKKEYCTIKPVNDGQWYNGDGYTQDKDKGVIAISESPTVNVFESRTAMGFEHVYRNEVRCACTEGVKGDDCRKEMLDLKTKIAANTTPRFTCPNGIKQIGSEDIGDTGDTRVEGNKLIITTKGNGKSLLQPMQFAKILSGHCKGGAPSYETCAIFAYMSKSSDNCKKMPPECLDDDYYLGGKEIPKNTSRR